MTILNELDEFRIFAKRLARKLDIPHHNALDIIAKQYGHSHWNALMRLGITGGVRRLMNS